MLLNKGFGRRSIILSYSLVGENETVGRPVSVVGKGVLGCADGVTVGNKNKLDEDYEKDRFV